MVGRGRRAVAPSVSSTSNTPREALGQCGAIRRYRPPLLPQPRENRGFAIVASGFAATAGTAAAPAPGKQATRVFLAFSLAVLHNIVYRQPTIPQNSKRFIHACRKDTQRGVRQLAELGGNCWCYVLQLWQRDVLRHDEE